MEMSFRQYIDNPMGKKNAVFSQRDVYKALYTDKFDKLLLREAGKINFTLYIDKATDRYIIHIKIPSETCKNFYYDAVICFFSNDPKAKSSSTLQDYNVKFFSNDPAFVFTYLRVFLKLDLFFEDMKPKSSKLALTEDPKEKNPFGIPGYSKILYFAYLFMKQKNLFAKHMYLSYAVPYSVKKLLNNVEHTDDKIADRQKAGEKAAKEKVDQKQEESKSTRTTVPAQYSPSGNIRSTKMVDQTNRVGSIKTSKKTKTVSRISKKK